MTYSPTIYDWPSTIEPHSSMFRAGGTSVSGGLTIGGMSVESPEPGGRSEYLLEFDPLAISNANRDASWLLSRMIGGNVMRVALWSPSEQLVPDADITPGPSAAVTLGGMQGAESFKVDMAAFGQKLKVGHVIGFTLDTYDFAHVVMSISYNGSNVATVSVSPPLRRDVTTADVMLFRPTMLATCPAARDIAATFRYGAQIPLGSIRLVEAMV